MKMVGKGLDERMNGKEGKASQGNPENAASDRMNRLASDHAGEGVDTPDLAQVEETSDAAETDEAELDAAESDAAETDAAESDAEGIAEASEEIPPDPALQKRIAGLQRMRQMAAWVMIVLFLLLILNLLFFHVLQAESVMLYVGLVVVFFLSNGMRGGVRQDGQLERSNSGKESGER